MLPIAALTVSIFLFLVNLFSASVAKLHPHFTNAPFSSMWLFCRVSVELNRLNLNLAQNLLRFILAALLVLIFIETGAHWPFLFLAAATVVFLACEPTPKIIAHRYPENSFALTLRIVPFLLLPFIPLSGLIYLFFRRYLKVMGLEEPMAKTKREIIEIIHEAKLSPNLSVQDKQLIESVLTFKERIAREVMVPRVDLFSLPSDTSIKKAAELIDKEGYSRIPIYKSSVDNIVGVLMYKDIIRKYMEFEQKNDPAILEAPIESIQKNVLYTPETKKISNLLLEFRKKQSHLAIVVDEYGGTEGIVTIEDILEEIVGEIADEYDDEEDLYLRQSDGSFLVDARMNILDVEEQLQITIPQEGEYDTVGGFIFHTAGSIPPKGFRIHQDTFDLEVVRSDDRRVHKVRIRPIIK
jgi:CBS domain containing-hemolysin-like protein